MIVELIDKIVVHEPIGKKPNREQKIDIYFNFIGQFELAYSSKEIAELKKQAHKADAEKKARQKKRNQEHQAKAKAKRYAENNGHMLIIGNRLISYAAFAQQRL